MGSGFAGWSLSLNKIPELMPAPTRIIDTHQHVFWHGRDDAGLVADMDEHGIEYAWLLTWEIAPSESHPNYAPALNPVRVRADGTMEGIPLDDLLVAKRNDPGRFVLGFCPHPLMGNAPARLKAAAAMYGVKICGEWKFRIPFDDPRCIVLFRTAGELGMPVVLHLDIPFPPDENGKPLYSDFWYGGTVDNLERALIACPETVFIGHASGFWRELSADADAKPGRDGYPTGPRFRPPARSTGYWKNTTISTPTSPPDRDALRWNGIPDTPKNFLRIFPQNFSLPATAMAANCMPFSLPSILMGRRWKTSIGETPQNSYPLQPRNNP